MSHASGRQRACIAAALLPPRLLQRPFLEAAEPLNRQRANLYRQNEKLRAARDLLLPRLMSGDLAV